MRVGLQEKIRASASKSPDSCAKNSDNAPPEGLPALYGDSRSPATGPTAESRVRAATSTV